MQENKTALDSLANTIKTFGTNAHNYSVDQLKKAAFVDELNNVVIHYQDSVAKNIIIEYIKLRIEEINKRYK